jgi:hypothetical protein
VQISKQETSIRLAIGWERRISMDEGREKLIEEIGELALQYDMKHSG